MSEDGEGGGLYSEVHVEQILTCPVGLGSCTVAPGSCVGKPGRDPAQREPGSGPKQGSRMNRMTDSQD